jgi:hypothetical protein
MLRKSGVQYLVLTNDIPTIFGNIIKTYIRIEPIMVNRLVKRVVCKRHRSKNRVEAGEWIRVMEGDIEYIGDTQRCTMTYITETKKVSEKNKVKDILTLKVDNFEDAIHFANKMGFYPKSYQETMRSKFLCVYNNVDYVLRFDVWAQIPDYTVIEVNLLSSGQNDFKNIVEQLKLKNYARNQHKVGEDGKAFALMSEEEIEENIKERKSVDIEELYEKLKGTKASELRNITFELGMLN